MTEEIINTTTSYEEISEQKLDTLPSEEDLVTLITKWEKESTSFNELLRREQDLCWQYYLGNQTKRDRVPAYLSNHVTNRVFEAVETATPIITSRPPEFIVQPKNNNEMAIMDAIDTQTIVSELYENLDIRQKLEVAARHMLLYRFGVLEIRWNSDLEEIEINYVKPQDIYIPRYGTNVYELPYIMKKQSYTAQDLKTNFPEVDLTDIVRDTDDRGEGSPEKLYRVWEVWTNDWVCWKSGSHILDKKENIYYDFKNKQNNLFNFPQKPFVFLAPFQFGEDIVGAASVTAQSIPIQDAINITIRKIIDHVIKMGNGAWLIDSEVMNQEEAMQKINNAAGIILNGPGVARQDMVRRDSPTPLPNHFFAMLNQLNAQFDNLFGLHSTTRGERGTQETATGRQLLKQADLGRMDLFVRVIEEAIQDMGNWIIQMMAMYYDDKKKFPVVGQDGIFKFITFKRDLIDSVKQLKVTFGSTLPTDPMSRRNQAIQLWQLGAIDPETLYKELNLPDPAGLAQKLLAFKMGQLAPAQVGPTVPAPQQQQVPLTNQ